MKQIQINVDPKKRTAAIYLSGKLLNLSIPEGWSYFYISNHRIDSDLIYFTFLKASACETEEELSEYIPILRGYTSGFNPYDWRVVHDDLQKDIENADTSKIRPSDRAIAVVYKHKLVMFSRDEDGDYCAENVKITNRQDKFMLLYRALMCETQNELDLFLPILELAEPNWKEKVMKIKEYLVDFSIS